MYPPILINSVKHCYGILIICFITILPFFVEAKTVAWSSKPYTHFSKEEPLKFLLEAVAADQNIPIKVSDNVNDVVSVYFKGVSPKSIIDDLKLAYGLISFYDGNILYIYKGTETQTASARLKRGSILVLDRYLRTEDLLEPNTKWELSEENNQVNFSGTKRFVDIVLKKAKSLDEEGNKKIFKCTINGKTVYSSSPPRYELCKETKIYRSKPAINKESLPSNTRPLSSQEDLAGLENE